MIALSLPSYQSVGVSSLLGFGVEEFFKLVDESRQEYIK